MKLTLESCIDDTCQNEIETIIKNTTLSEIIKRWVTTDRSIVVISGSDDDKKEHRVYLLFENNRREVASAYYCKDEVIKERPIVSQLIPPPMQTTQFEVIESQEDCEFFERQDKISLSKWNEELYEYVMSLDAAINSALGLALGEYGETVFADFTQGFTQELSNSETYANHFMFATCIRATMDQTYRQHGSFYIDLNLS